MTAVAMITMKVQKIFLSDCNETSQEWSWECMEVHSGFEYFRMAIVTMATTKVQTCLNLEFQNIENKFGYGFSLAEFVWKTL